MHYKNYTAGAPSEAVTYSPKLWRSMSAQVDWHSIETSDNVFDWTRLDAIVAYFDGQGQDIYYQIYSTPAHARAVGATWTTVPDQDGVAGAGCVPDQTKLARFVTALLTRYPQIKYISPWNEPKAGGDAVLRFTGTTTGSVSVGQSVTQVSTGATGTVVSNSGTSLVVRASGPAYTATAFDASNQIRVDGSNYFTPSAQAAVWYWFGTRAELVATAQTVYNAAKAVRSSIIVTTPDFVEGANISGEEEWLATWLDAGGRGYFDVVAYHFYNYDIRAATQSGNAYSVATRCDDLEAILSTRGVNSRLIASECGYTPGWAFWTAQAGYRAQALKRVTAYLAVRGWLAVLWYDHTEAYGGSPATVPEVANAYDWLGRTLSGASIVDAQVGADQILYFVANGEAQGV